MTETGPEASPSIVLWSSGKYCRIFRNGIEVDCTIDSDVLEEMGGSIAVGDVVEMDPANPQTVRRVLPRRTVLARPDPHIAQRQRVLVANVDLVIHVVSVKAPPLRTPLIDRFLIAAQKGGAKSLICVNKIDLISSEALDRELERLQPYRDTGVPLVFCSTTDATGLQQLRTAIDGLCSALVGHSGVGKSSILNALNSGLELKTGALHRRGTGRHTTSASTLYDLGGNTWVIDTPGIREFGLWDLDAAELREYFPEFEEAALSCRFRNCSHIHEPSCEVKRRVDAGDIAKSRYDIYVRLTEEVGERK